MRAPRKAFMFTSFCEYNFINTLPCCWTYAKRLNCRAHKKPRTRPDRGRCGVLVFDALCPTLIPDVSKFGQNCQSLVTAFGPMKTKSKTQDPRRYSRLV